MMNKRNIIEERKKILKNALHEICTNSYKIPSFNENINYKLEYYRDDNISISFSNSLKTLINFHIKENKINEKPIKSFYWDVINKGICAKKYFKYIVEEILNDIFPKITEIDNIMLFLLTFCMGYKGIFYTITESSTIYKKFLIEKILNDDFTFTKKITHSNINKINQKIAENRKKIKEKYIEKVQLSNSDKIEYSDLITDLNFIEFIKKNNEWIYNKFINFMIENIKFKNPEILKKNLYFNYFLIILLKYEQKWLTVKS